MLARSIYTVALLTLSAVWARGQADAVRMEFDVASVRANKEMGRSLLEATPGRFSATGIAVDRLLMIAYDVRDFQVVDAPAWAKAERYDIAARASDDATVQQMEGPMLQRLLEERFKLRVHRETRMVPLYELTVGEKGSKLRRTEEGSCRPYVKEAQPAGAAGAGEAQVSYCGFRRSADGAGRTLDGKGVSVGDLAANLSHSYNTTLERNVVDKTGIKGSFDMKLRWTNDPDSVPGGDAGGADVSLFVALQEQLGLKLRSAKGAMEVLVIDHIEQPSAN